MVGFEAGPSAARTAAGVALPLVAVLRLWFLLADGRCGFGGSVLGRNSRG